VLRLIDRSFVVLTNVPIFSFAWPVDACEDAVVEVSDWGVGFGGVCGVGFGGACGFDSAEAPGLPAGGFWLSVEPDGFVSGVLGDGIVGPFPLATGCVGTGEPASLDGAGAAMPDGVVVGCACGVGIGVGGPVPTDGG